MIKEPFWAPITEVLEVVRQRTKECRTIVDVGGGVYPLSFATDIIDHVRPETPSGTRCHDLDITREPLPFGPGEADFLYCRHTLEDLPDPTFTLSEIARVARGGYLETPSPIQELCRGTDAGRPKYRGHAHHHYVVWAEEGCLWFLPKYPIIEHLDFGNLELQWIDVLNQGPLFWNTYYVFEKPLKFKILRHGFEFLILPDYERLLLKAAKASLISIAEFAKSSLPGLFSKGD